jgi:hypothetical protein
MAEFLKKPTTKKKTGPIKTEKKMHLNHPSEMVKLV